MAKPTLTSSASLHLRLGAFAALFTALVAVFTPVEAFALAVVAAFILSKL
ncbi:hypothetical protein [Pseudoalteromonas piscicida]|nr:hypothetical protein [Pseudoalteromonas piscicida]